MSLFIKRFMTYELPTFRWTVRQAFGASEEVASRVPLRVLGSVALFGALLVALLTVTAHNSPWGFLWIIAFAILGTWELSGWEGDHPTFSSYCIAKGTGLMLVPIVAATVFIDRLKAPSEDEFEAWLQAIKPLVPELQEAKDFAEILSTNISELPDRYAPLRKRLRAALDGFLSEIEVCKGSIYSHEEGNILSLRALDDDVRHLQKLLAPWGHPELPMLIDELKKGDGWPLPTAADPFVSMDGTTNFAAMEVSGLERGRLMVQVQNRAKSQAQTWEKLVSALECLTRTLPTRSPRRKRSRLVV
jgi:hypothetical protein